MPDHSSVSALLVHAEVDSMGGVVDCAVAVDTKASPRSVAIDKAQAELLQTCDVREEWKREIEFLENGGDPLDFKVSHAGSLSVQSTSITDQLAEQEAKGSFALAPSPHGDSVESSGRPSGSSGREPNIADNLLLFDGENSNIGGEKNNNNHKRGNGGPLEECSQINGCHNPKEADESVIFRLGFKRQAYARRNRSRSSRDSAHAGSSDFTLGDNNKLTSNPSTRSDSQQGLLCGTQSEDHALSSISNSKPTLNGNIVPKTSASEDPMDMKLDAVQSTGTCSDTMKGGAPDGESDVNASVRLHGHDTNGKEFCEALEKDHDAAALLSSNYNGNKAISVGFLPVPLGCSMDIKENKANEEVSHFDSSGKGLKDINDVIMSPTMDEKANTDGCSTLKIIDGDGISSGDGKELPTFQESLSRPDKICLSEKSKLVADDLQIAVSDEPRAVCPTHDYSSIQIKDEVELCDGKIEMQNEARVCTNGDVKLNGEVIVKSENMQENCIGDSSCSADKPRIASNLVASCEHASATLSNTDSATISGFENGLGTPLKLEKAHEDAILKEAQIIEANLRRAEQLPMSTGFLNKRKCHWDFVLEEMAWMANDFMQERAWKTVTAAQVCNTIVSTGLLKFEEVNMRRKQRIVARTLSKAIMQFWHTAENFRSSAKELISGSDLFITRKADNADAEKQKGVNNEQAENVVQIQRPALQGYAIRFLNFISSTSMHPLLAEAPTTPDRTNDAGIAGIPWNDQHSQERLFYVVPPGGMRIYRESIELQWMHSKKSSNRFHEEEWEQSICDSVPDGPRQNAYEEDANENYAYFFPGAAESTLSSKHANRKRKMSQHKSHAGRLYTVAGDLSYEQRVESKYGIQPVIYTGKRPSSTVDVGSVPTKRMRTATRQRVASPFSAGVTGSQQMISKTDVSSGDTNSFQDDQSSPYGVSHSRRDMEVETTTGFDRQSPFDGCEISSKSKKKKKPKHLGYKNSLSLTDSGVLMLPGKGSLYEQKLAPDSMIRLEQRDQAKKRFESQRFESNGNLGQYGHLAAKKPKLLKQLPETSVEANAPFAGSVPSPVASQMSNMSGPNRIIRIHKDRGRKSKGMKMTAGQSGSGNPWSNFEEQALVVLVHDMGTNWELISDAINSTLQFKRVFRTPSECKERHKILMESNVDGADSAEDSGSSQQYRSTLPGIPKGSARQLFQRLQAPVEEDTLKAHFEKIISIGQKSHSFRSMNDTREMEKVTPAHNSHVVALSQVCPNNLHRTVILTPLDLCDTISSSSDTLSHGYQGSQTNNLPNPSHPSPSSLVIPTSGGGTMLQGSPSLVLNNSVPSPSRSHSGSTRDTQRYSMPRPTTLPADDQQRMQQYSQMISGRNVQQPSMSIPGTLSAGVDRSVRMLPGANGMGMMCSINRGIPAPRPNFQGMNPSGMINLVSTGSMLPGNAGGMQNPANVHPSAVSGSGNSLLRPRPGQNTEEHRQMMMQELQHQVSQGSCQSVAPFSGVSAPFSNATVPPPVHAFPAQQHQQPHQMPQQPHIIGNTNHPHIHASNHSSQQQQAYAIRLAKERQQQQQRLMPQPQHPFSGSNTVSSITNSSQIQQQVQSSTPGNSVPSSVAQQKQQQMPRNAQSGNGINVQSGNGMSNPMMKQRQRQQVQHQQSRPQQQQRQISQQQAKIMKGLGRGTPVMHQNLPVEGSHASGLSAAPKNQVSEKHPIQHSQGFFPGSSVLNSTLPQPANQQKMYPRPLPQPSKQMSPMSSSSDNLNQGSTQVPPAHTLLASHQPPVPSSLPLTAQQHQQRQTNQPQQSMQRATVHQMIPATPTPQGTDSSAPVVASGNQWKAEPSYDTSIPIPTAHHASSPQENLVGAETLMASSNQGLGQRQFSGSLPLHKHGIGGQWQQQPPPHHQQAQLQHRPGGAQGNMRARSSNSGPG